MALSRRPACTHVRALAGGLARGCTAPSSVQWYCSSTSKWALILWTRPAPWSGRSPRHQAGSSRCGVQLRVSGGRGVTPCVGCGSQSLAVTDIGWTYVMFCDGARLASSAGPGPVCVAGQGDRGRRVLGDRLLCLENALRDCRQADLQARPAARLLRMIHAVHLMHACCRAQLQRMQHA